jgi:thioredoxin-like negative regulator of GroEL
MTPEQSLDAAIGYPDPVIVCVTMEHCRPCIRLKPAIRKLAIEFGASFRLIEVDRDAVTTFRKRYEIDRYPQLLAFRGGILREHHIGLHGLSATRAFVTGFLGLPASVDQSEQGRAFEAAFTRAETAMNERLEPASDALTPHLEAVSPEASRLDQRVAEAVKRGELDSADAQDALRKGYELLYAPFRAKVDTLRQAQLSAMHIFETITAEGIRAYANTTADSTLIRVPQNAAA